MTPPTTPPTTHPPATTGADAAEPMTDTELAEIAAREAKAKPGPMIAELRRNDFDGTAECFFTNGKPVNDSKYWDSTLMERLEDAEFYASARTDVPRLLHEVARQRAELSAARASLAACRAALEFYANRHTYDEGGPIGGAIDGVVPINEDKGSRAAAALADAGRDGGEGG